MVRKFSEPRDVVITSCFAYNVRRTEGNVAQEIIPNQFVIQGQGIHIVYSTSGIAGRRELTFKKGRQSLSFTGDEIVLTDLKIGTLVSVIIASIPDRSVTSFGFLIPMIRLAKESAKQSFRTLGITTVDKTTISGPGKGAQQSYKAAQLRGTAQQVRSVA
jgi:hypothetical protein